MSGSRTATPVRTHALTDDRRRVRHEVRDGLAVVLFSASASLALALAMTLLTRIGN